MISEKEQQATTQSGKKSREEKIKEIVSIFVELGIFEPRTEEERQAVEERRQKLGAEKFDRIARAAYIDLMTFIEALEKEATEKKEEAQTNDRQENTSSACRY